MKSKVFGFFIVGMMCCLLTAAAVEAASTSGEEALFTTSTAPDALLLVDLSGSMAWNPPGDDLTYGSTDSCYADTANCTGTGCSSGFCGNSKPPTPYYANATCGVADATNCVGANCSNGFCTVSKSSSTIYAATSCSVPDTYNCKGTGCGRSDGFCNSPLSGTTYYAHASCNWPDTNNCRHTEQWQDCNNGFCASPHSSSWRTCTVECTTAPCNTSCEIGTSCSVSCTSGGCTKSCSRLAIAKRAIANILDDNNDGTINSTDETSLGVRLGYMRFKNCNDDEPGGGLSYTSGCNTLVKGINTSYNSINTAVQAESASGGTPIFSALNEAKLYLTDHKATDNAKDCRQKFVILITDGSDTYACNADGSECDNARYKNRRAVVAKAKALGDAGYKVFVIGFGTAMPPYLKNTLNWMAYYGGTDNPNTANAGSPTGYSIVTGCKVDPATGSKVDPAVCCDVTESACYPTGVTACATDSSALLNGVCYDSTRPYPGTAGNEIDYFQASSNDPGYLELSGYAFIAGSADELVAAVKSAINIIREATYSFSQSSIQSNRTVDENFIYEGSFQPLTDDPFWIGHLKKYNINATTGDVEAVSDTWGSDGDAGAVLKNTASTDRVIKTYKGGSLVDFTTGLTKEDLAVTTDAGRDAVVNFIRGGDTAYNAGDPKYGWKLGDVFRSTPITVGTPSVYYEDARDTTSPSAFHTHRANHERSSANGYRFVTVGANDGQLHAFKTSNGTEAWSFIAPNLLSRLKLITHATHPTTLGHQYFVDGPVTVADVWIPASASSGTTKSDSDWHTLLVFGEGRGAGANIWSSSSYCDSGFNPMYTSTYQYYCGYYALDVTNNGVTPTFKWRLGLSASQAPYMGAPWSRVLTGRVKVGGNERWLGFIGGGVYAPNATHSGKGFFAVDLYDGSVLWSYTRADNSALDNPMPAPPAIVDTDNDGFIDTAYIGDIGGNMWRMKFCKAADGDSCTTSNWTGARFFEAKASSGIRPIYTLAAVSKDSEGNFWVYWGTGDKTDPTAANAQEVIFAVKDRDFTSTVTGDQIQNITTEGGVYNDPNKYGYFINLAGSGEKMLSDVTVFGGVLYVATFTPEQSNNPCKQGGEAKLYGVGATSGAGALAIPGVTEAPRSMSIGTGISSAPVISLKPGSAGTPDLYVTTSGGGATGAQTQRVNINPPGMANRTNLLFWKDRRVE